MLDDVCSQRLRLSVLPLSWRTTGDRTEQGLTDKAIAHPLQDVADKLFRAASNFNFSPAELDGA